MAAKTIPDLPAADPLTGSEQLEIVQAGTNKNTTTQEVGDLGGGGGGGEANTGANVGSGADIFRDKTGVTLNFRGVLGVNTIATSVNGDNVEVDVLDGKITNAKLEAMAAWTVKVRNDAVNGVPQDQASGDITEDLSPASGDLLFGWASTGELRTFDVGNLPTGGGGEANTGANVGTGADVFRDKTGVTLNFRGIAGTGGLSAAVNGDNIEVDLPDLAVTTAKLAADAVTNANLADMAAYTIKLRNAGTTGDPGDVKVSALTEEASPASGDWILGEVAGGELRRYDVGNLPSGGGGGGLYVQKIKADKTDTQSTTSTSYVDVTGMAVTITPDDALNILELDFYVMAAGASTGDYGRLQITDSSNVAVPPTTDGNDWHATVVGIGGSFHIHLEVVAGSTSAQTFKLRMEANTGDTIEINDTFGGGTRTSMSSCTVAERTP